MRIPKRVYFVTKSFGPIPFGSAGAIETLSVSFADGSSWTVCPDELSTRKPKKPKKKARK